MSELPDPDVAVQAFKDEVIKHSSFMSRILAIPDGFTYGFSTGFGLTAVLLSVYVWDFGYSAILPLVITAILAGLIGGQYKARLAVRESVYRRDDNRKYEKIKRIEAAVARIKPKEIEGFEGAISEFVEGWRKEIWRMQSTLDEIHTELKILNKSANPYPEFRELSRFDSFLSMESALERIEQRFDELAVLLELEPFRMTSSFKVEILDLERQLRDIEGLLADITP